VENIWGVAYREDWVDVCKDPTCAECIRPIERFIAYRTTYREAMAALVPAVRWYFSDDEEKLQTLYVLAEEFSALPTTANQREILRYIFVSPHGDRAWHRHIKFYVARVPLTGFGPEL